MTVPTPGPVDDDNDPDTPPVLAGGLPRAGRGFAPLQVGQTIRVVFDNPTVREFYDGYFIRLNTRNGDSTAGGNICYDYPGYSTACSAASEVPIGTEPEPKLTLQRFEYFDDGQWGIVNNDNPDADSEFHHIPLFDTDTAAAGAQIDLTITGADTYQLTIDPFGPAPTHMETGTLMTAGKPIDWIEFTFFNTNLPPGDYNNNGRVDAADYVLWRNGVPGSLQNEVVTPGQVTPSDYTEWRARFGRDATDLFIRSIEIFDGTPGAAAAVPEPSTFVYLFGAIAGMAAWRVRTTMPQRRGVGQRRRTLNG